MATTEHLTNEEKFANSLSLTGRLTLQERKEKKDRRGRITFKRKNSYWFWFDEKECCLKYYKNSETYYTHLYKYDGLIDMKDAKLSPSEVYLDSVGSLSIDPDVVSNRTFIVITTTNDMYALTADKDITCHLWIKKLQEKRAIWDKKVSFKAHRNQSSKEVGRSMRENQGLVSSPDFKTTSPQAVPSSSSSHVRRMFDDLLGEQKIGESCPSSISPLPPSTPISPGEGGVVTDPVTVLSSPHGPATTDSLPAGQITNDVETDFVDKDGTEPAVVKTEGQGDTSLVDSIVLSGLDSRHDYEELLKKPLTDTERELVKSYMDLAETRQENECLHQKIAFLEDEKDKQYHQKMQLVNEMQELWETVQKLKADKPVQYLHNENENLRDVIKQLKRSLGSVDGEIELYKNKLEERDRRLSESYKKVRELEDNLLYFKAKYVSLLNWSFKIPTPGPGGSVNEETDTVEEKLKEDLLDLIKQESSVDNPLVDISGNQSVFEDQYGELHDWNNDSNICHFLCRQLYLHYTQYDQDSNVQEWYNYTKSLKTNKDGHWEIPSETFRIKRRELRGYLRRGVPQPMRSAMWTSLIYSYVGKMRDVMNSTANNNNYYQALLQRPTPFKKQILLDQYRTMPSNKHFKLGGLGAKKLENVLVAYSNHNINVGYCQGMNMIVAAALLYLDEEMTFWYLVAVIEKLMPANYYTNGLAAAQADQAVMKTLVEEKLPHFSNHLEESGIDVTVVTFNWFLTLFIDALPTESMLRVMDCFLLEGRKVFYRLSLAILKLHERRILSLHDPVKIFQFLKEVAKHIFNVEELFKVAFEELEPFPSRATIQARFKPHSERFMNEWKEREARKKASVSSPSRPPSSGAPLTSSYTPAKQKKLLQWECGAIVKPGELWLCCGERQTGKVCIVRVSEEGLDVNCPVLNVGSKILCIKALSNSVVMVGTLDFFVHAICTESKTELWSMKMNDTVLDFVSYKNSIIFAQADGYIAAVATPDVRLPSPSDPILYRMGSTAVQCMVISPFGHVWVGCGKAITILEAETYDPVEALVISDKADKIYKMEPSDQGVWVTFKNSTLLYLYDYQYRIPVFSVDYTSLFPSRKDLLRPNGFDNRVTVAMIIQDMLWIGTGCGSCHVFRISSLVAKPAEQIRQLAKIKNRSVNRFEGKVSRSMTEHMMSTAEDEGLVSDIGLSITAQQQKGEDEADTCKLDTDDLDKETQSRRVFNRQKVFGKTFHRHIKKDASQGDVRQRDSIYKLDYLWTGNNVVIENDCSKITVLQPLKRKDQLLVISCMSSTTRAEHAVQMWKSDNKEVPSWNCRLLDDCYSLVSKQSSPRKPSSADVSKPHPVVQRRRTYSNMLGSFSKADLDVMSSSVAPPTLPTTDETTEELTQ